MIRTRNSVVAQAPGGIMAGSKGAVLRSMGLALIVIFLTPLSDADSCCAGQQRGGVGAAPQAVTARELLAVAEMSGVTVSPDGKDVSVRVAWRSLAGNTVRLKWYILDIGSEKVLASADGGAADWAPSGEVTEQTPQWSGNSRWLYFRAYRGNRLSICRLGLSGTFSEVVAGPADIDSFRLDDRDGRIFYVVGPSRRVLRSAMAREYRSGVILDGTQYLGDSLENNLPDGLRLTSVRLRGDGRGWRVVGDAGVRTLMVAEEATGKSHPAAPAEARTYRSLGPPVVMKGIRSVYGLARDRASGDVAFIGTPGRAQDGRDEDRSALGIRKKDGELVWCRYVECRYLTGGVAWRPGTDEFLFTAAHVRGVGTTELAWNPVMYSWDESTGRVREVFHTRGLFGPSSEPWTASQCPVTAVYALCVVQSACSPPLLVRIDLSSGVSFAVFDPNRKLRSDIGRSGVSRHAKYTLWRDSRGLYHSGVFLRAPAPGPGGTAPALVITSYLCSGFLTGGTGSTTPEILLWEHGFSVLCTSADDVIKARAYEAPLPPGEVARFAYMYDGWKSAAAHLAAQGLIDPAHIGISGLSFTAGVVNYVVAHHPRFAAAATAGHLISTDPMDYYLFGAMGAFGGRAAQAWPFPDPSSPAGRRYYANASDALGASHICTPLLVQIDAGEVVYGLQYLGALRLVKAPAEVIAFPEETHIFWKPENLLAVQRRNVDWFRFWLQHDQPAEPDLIPMYSRWRRIRAGLKRRGSCPAGGGDPGAAARVSDPPQSSWWPRTAGLG